MTNGVIGSIYLKGVSNEFVFTKFLCQFFTQHAPEFRKVFGTAYYFVFCA